MTPFVVLALPRSRSFWLSRALTYGDWSCGHDELRHARSLDDVRAWLSQPFTGTVETAGAPHWRLLRQMCPDARVVVLRRPVDEAIESWMRIDWRGTGAFDRQTVERTFRRLDAKLAQVEARVPGVLSVQSADLGNEGVFARVFEHCLGLPHDPLWWRAMVALNLQYPQPPRMRYLGANRAALEKLAAVATQAQRAAMAARPVEAEGIVFAQEPFDVWYRDAEPLFREHCSLVGEEPDSFRRKNARLARLLYRVGAMQITTARCNGRMFGYLMTVVGPTLEADGVREAEDKTFFASPAIRGLGMKIKRASDAALAAQGVRAVWSRADERGVRGIDVIYRRMGAENRGRMFRRSLEAA